MTSVIRILGFAGGYPCSCAGQYLASVDFEAREGRGDFTTTRNIENALKFNTPSKAFLFWKTRSKTVPTRPDGKPNRPLTMAHVEILEAM